MFTGFIPSFRINRPLTQNERDEALPHERQPGIEPGQHLSLIRINSTYIDWIDRRFAFRGSMPMCLATVIGLGMAWFYLYWLFPRTVLVLGSDPDFWWTIMFTIFEVGFISLFLKFILLKEYFTYTHYPIRFNRKIRMVHVFRHNGRNGVLSVPWDQVFFHIGHLRQRSANVPDDLDIRGEVLEGDIVRDAFALGHAAPNGRKRDLLEMWEFIRRYMDEGPEAVAEHPLDRYVALSVRPTLKNCFLFMGSYYAGGLPRFFQVLVSPFVLLYTLTRWVVLHTCRTPVFPPEIEATCQVAADDPHVWPIPRSCGEFAATVPGLLEHAQAKARRSWQAERQRQGKLPLGNDAW